MGESNDGDEGAGEAQGAQGLPVPREGQHDGRRLHPGNGGLHVELQLPVRDCVPEVHAGHRGGLCAPQRQAHDGGLYIRGDCSSKSDPRREGKDAKEMRAEARQ